MNLPTSLHFHGPLTFVDHGRGIARTPFARSEGIYLWCLGDGDRRFIHYVGETTDFLKRHKEHVTNILGANYGIFRADAVASDDPSPIFGGMWRDGSADAITATVGQWQGLQRDVLAYLARSACSSHRRRCRTHCASTSRGASPGSSPSDMRAKRGSIRQTTEPRPCLIPSAT